MEGESRVPVPKKQSRDIILCVTDNFRGISLTSTVSKMLCMGSFRKQRGSRDPFLTLVLLGQTEVTKAAKGMLVAFIDFSKVTR